MATIKKSDIYDGNISKAEHITRIIDALDGTAATEIVATGSFTGSFIGDGSGLTGVGGGGSGIFAQTGSYYATTNDLQITGSLTIRDNNTLIQIGSSTDTINIIPTSLVITGSKLTMNSFDSRSTIDLSAMRFGSGFTLSSNQPDEPQLGTMYWNNTSKKLYIHDGSGWYTSSFGAV